MPAELVRDHLALLLLALLAAGPSHGYGLIAELGTRSGGYLQLPEGSIYPALHRLPEAGLIQSRPGNNHGRARRIYVITARGKRELTRQRQEWWRFASTVDSILRQVRIRAQ